MKIKVFLAIVACKMSTKLLRLFGRGGTAIPGKLALRICPELLGVVSRDVKCVVVTGTNGKTTSSRIIEEIFSKSGVSYFANRSGANLINGITAEFVEHSTLTGRAKKKYAVIESDEAASKQVCRFINPKAVLVTNVFQDQLDRFGDISCTLKNIQIGISNSPEAVVCLNADCSLTSSLAHKIPNRTIFYGVDVPIYEKPVDELSDASHCPECKCEYKYSYRTFGHLGGFYCPQCGNKRPDPQVSVMEIVSLDLDTTTVRARIFDEESLLTINLPGGYNIYNAAGALAVAEAMELDRETARQAVSSFHCGFGRMEQFDMDNAKARMILVKNSAGCNQVLNYLTGLNDETIFVCCLNDNTGDGTDVSWVWDVNFEKLSDMEHPPQRFFVGGIRRADMALRLKYAGIPEDKILIFDDYDELIEAMRSQSLPVVIMPTYSAMMDLRAKMSAAFGGRDFWK